jgi:hypothetical protein
MENKKLYLVIDISSECAYSDGLGIYTSYELAIEAIEEGIKGYSGTETEIYFHCFEIEVNNPISGYTEIATYTEGQWNRPDKVEE